MNGSRRRLGKKSKSFWKQIKWTHNNLKLLGHSKGSPEGEVHRDTGLPKKDRDISNKLPNAISIRIQGTTTKTTQSKQKEGNNKDQSRVKWQRVQKYNSKNQ